MVSVLHVTESTSGGVARLLGELVRDQAARGWRIDVAAPARHDLPTLVTQWGGSYHDWPAQRAPGLSTVAEILALRSIVRAVRPDVVHLHSSKAGFAGRLVVRSRIPTMFQPHAWSFFALGGRAARAATAWERFGARWTDLLVCGSSEELRVGRAAGIRSEGVVIPNSVDTERFRPVAEQERAEWRRDLLGLDSEPLVVCPGRFCHQKGQDVLLLAWPKVRASVPDARLVLVGGGPDEAMLRASASSDVRFAGWQDDISRWLAIADVVVQPSRYETLCLTTLEAMALRRPVVATAAVGMSEALGVDDGALVPVGAAGPLADALIERLADPVTAEADAERGRRRVEELFSTTRWRDAMAAATTRVLAGGGPTDAGATP